MTEDATQIDELLLRHESLWRPVPFAQQAKPNWLPHQSALANYLLALSDDDVQHLQGDDFALLDALTPYFPEAVKIRRLISLPAPLSPDEYLGGVFEPPTGIPGRKWQQICQFVEALRPGPDNYIEWCAGKGYLGEALCEHGGQVLSLEIEADLVAAGNARSEKLQLQRRSLQCDVLSDEVELLLTPEQHLVALHACGGLHQRLLTATTSSGCRRLHLSPCCYHRYREDYQPLSAFYRQSPLTLDLQSLRLAVRQTTTARAGETRARRTLQAWQLALRILLEDEGVPAPSHFPALPMSWAQHDFASYCAEVSRRCSLPALQIRAAQQAIDQGWQQLRRIERLELLTMCFRRLLELRCVTDSQLYLEENGFRASIHTFCPPSLTPRNLMLVAERLG